MVTLTKRQIEVIGLSFAVLNEASIARLMDLLYERLFKMDPTLEKRMFAHINMGDQKQKLTSAIQTVVKSLSNLSAIVPTLKDLGKIHAGYGVTEKEYGQVGSALLYALSEVLNDDFTSEVEKSWTDAYEIISATMQEGAAEIVA